MSDYVNYLKSKEEIQSLKEARSRCWSSWLWTLGLGAFGSVVRSCQTNNWKPTFIATAVAVPCLGLASVDMGFTLITAPPITAGAVFTANAMSARRRLGFNTPEQADAALFEKGMV